MFGLVLEQVCALGAAYHYLYAGIVFRKRVAG